MKRSSGVNGRQDPIDEAVKNHDLTKVLEILNTDDYHFGYNKNDFDSKKWTLFHAAAIVGNETVVRFLIENGASINSSTYDSTPLHIAAEYGTF